MSLLSSLCTALDGLECLTFRRDNAAFERRPTTSQMRPPRCRKKRAVELLYREIAIERIIECRKGPKGRVNTPRTRIHSSGCIVVVTALKIVKVALEVIPRYAYAHVARPSV
jgi:hypothetical protein